MNNKDKIARMEVFQLNAQIKELNNTTLGSLLNRLDALESLTSAQATTISELQTVITAYPNHTHDYEDKYGTITETKTTQGVNQ